MYNSSQFLAVRPTFLDFTDDVAYDLKRCVSRKAKKRENLPKERRGTTMKKLFALILSLCLLAACCAFAEEAEEDNGMPEINWADFEEAASQIDGQFVAIADLGLKMFVPAVFGNAEVSEEQKAAGVIAILSTADGAGRVSITYQNLGEMDDEAFVEELEKAGATDIDPAILNGGDAMSYDLEVNGTKTTNVVIPFEGGDIVTFSFAPMDDEGFKGVAAIMIASIQDAE